jgi:spoIIIJ-associated protein
MKKFSGKTVEEAIELAVREYGISAEELNYEVTEEKKGLFSKSATIAVYLPSDVIEYAEKYLRTLIEDVGLSFESNSVLEDGIIKISFNTSHNAVIIGKNGRTLQAYNEVVRSAVHYHFKKYYRILLDINSYKDEKYAKLERMAKRIAKEVQRTHVNAVLDPMSSDERRVVHNALGGFNNIRTESSGTGHRRQITICYVEEK